MNFVVRLQRDSVNTGATFSNKRAQNEVRNPTLFYLRLGLWTSESGSSEIVAMRGRLLQQESSKWGAKPHIVLFMLGFMNFGGWLERDSGKAGATFSNKRAQKWGAKPHIVLFTLGFMNFGVWLERDSGNTGATFSNKRAQKWGAKPHIVLFTLGFMNFGGWLPRDSGKVGATFSNKRAQKWGAKPHIVLFTLGFMNFGGWLERDIVAKRGRLSPTRELKSVVRNPTLFYLRLGLWTAESGSSELVAMRGRLSQTRELNAGYPPKTRDFRNYKNYFNQQPPLTVNAWLFMLYRVSHKKRNGGFSVHCEQKVVNILRHCIKYLPQKRMIPKSFNLVG